MLRQSTLDFPKIPTGRPTSADKAPDTAKRASSVSRENASAPSTASQQYALCTPPSTQRTSTPPPLTEETAMELSNDLPDSTDWIQTSLPAFEPLEAALRCQVCKEFYNNPVITSCSHTFCSLCIRRCISSDGKCPACKKTCQADKLMPNIAVREVATHFQAARSKALELARSEQEDRDPPANGKKRKLEETDLEEEAPARHTRSRQTRSSARTGGAVATENEPLVIPDSEEEADGEYMPEGMAKCPICQDTMKAHLVFDHVNTCTGERSARSRKPPAFPVALQNRTRDPVLPTKRLSGLNYRLLTETALRKKLQELKIPTTGSREAMINRHREWLNIYNANCDASDAVRKTHRELLKDLGEWERTQGGRGAVKGSHDRWKDFDDKGHATTHKGQFDDLIANARKRTKVEPKRTTAEEVTDGSDAHEAQPPDTSRIPDPTPPQEAPQSNQPIPKPYENNEAALSIIREKVEEANRQDHASRVLSREMSNANERAAQEARNDEETATGIRDPFGSPSRTMPMFTLPADPVSDVDGSTSVQ